LYADNKVQWTTGDNSDGIDGLEGSPAQVGIIQGNRVNFSVISKSCTDGIIHHFSGNSNIDMPGVYVIRISDGMMPNCKF